MPERTKQQRLLPHVALSQADGAEDYEEAEQKARNIIGPRLTGDDMGPVRERVPLSPVTSVANSPDVEYLIGTLYSVVMSEGTKLAAAAQKDNTKPLDQSQMATLTRLVDATKQLTKLRIEVEKLEAPDNLSKPEMIAALREQIELLESE